MLFATVWEHVWVGHGPGEVKDFVLLSRQRLQPMRATRGPSGSHLSKNMPHMPLKTACNATF